MNTEVALVTGAASGMGRSTAAAFLNHGWTVLALDVSPVDSADGPGRLIPVAVDVRDRSGIESALATHLPELGGAIDGRGCSPAVAPRAS